MTSFRTEIWPNAVNRGITLILGGEEDFPLPRPAERTHPTVKTFCHILLLSRLPVIQHQPPAVALVSRPRLRAIGDVLSIRRIERSVVGSFVLSSDVLR